MAEQRSFTRAAVALNRTQSAVSMQVKRLEERLQAELFHRTKSNVDLSAAGEGLLGYARRILSLNEEAVGRVREQNIEGRVRLGVMDDYGTLLVPPLLASFIANYPLIDVEMETGLTSTMTGRLGKTFDIVIAMHPEGHSEGELLRREQAVWAGEYRASRGAIRPAAGGALSARLPVPQLGHAGAGQGAPPVAARLRQPQPDRGRGHRGAGPCGDGGQVRDVSVQLRRLTARDGLPPLPRAEIRLHRAPKLSRAATLLADHLVAALAEPSRHRQRRTQSSS